MKKYYSIGETSKILDVNNETLRRWDKTGKFKSSRNPINNYRVYSEDQINYFVNELQVEFQFEKEKNNTKTPKGAFFKSKYGKLYNQDAIKFLKTCETNSADLVFADPPYNIKKAEWDTFESQKHYVEWSVEWIKEAHRVLNYNGSLYICGFSEILADLKWATAHLFKGCKWLIWSYRNKANLTNDWGRSHESILHLRKSKNFIFNIDEARIPYNSHTLKYPTHPQAKSSQYGNGKQYIWSPNPKGAKPKDVFDIPTISNKSWEKMDHPTQKPVELLRKIILTSSNQESLIIDPFGGSGTTYAIAEAYKRNWVGTELNIKYCKLLQNRLENKNLIRRILSAKDEKESQIRRQKLKT